MAWTTSIANAARPVTRAASRALTFLPVLPWYAWAGIAGGLALLLGMARTAGAATASTVPTPELPGGPAPVVKLGSTGPWVSYLQGRLSITQTGSFDAATDKVVKDYQAAHGLTADGVVGALTWSALGVAPVPAPGPGPGPAPAPPPTPQPPGPPSGSNPFGLAEGVSDREGQILAHVAQGRYERQWWPLSWTKNGHTVSVMVTRMPLMLSDGTNRLIVNATYPTTQKLADMLGGALLTTKVSDEIQKQADKKIAPPSKPWQGTGTDNSGSKTFRMYDQSADLLGKTDGGSGGLLSNLGKDWVLTRRFWVPPAGTGSAAQVHHSANFGWYAPGTNSFSPGQLSVIQSVGLVHDMGHTDYSQLVRMLDPSSLGCVDPRIVNRNEPSDGLHYAVGMNIARLVQGGKDLGAWRTPAGGARPKLGDLCYYAMDPPQEKSDGTKDYHEHVNVAIDTTGDAWKSADAGRTNPKDGKQMAEFVTRKRLSDGRIDYYGGPRKLIGWVDLTALPFTKPPNLA